MKSVTEKTAANLASMTTAEQRIAAPMIRKPDVLKALGISSPTLYRLIRDGRFPKPLQIGGRAVGWLQSDVNEYIAGLVADRAANA